MSPTSFFNLQKAIENPGWDIFKGGLISFIRIQRYRYKIDTCQIMPDFCTRILIKSA